MFYTRFRHRLHLRRLPQSELEELDYDLLEENSGQGATDACYSDAWDDQQSGIEHLAEQSECQSFFSHNLDLLARLADLMPEKIMDMVVSFWLGRK